jgi:ribonucleotide reductase alpha subunit
MRLRDILREMDKKYFDKKGLDFYELDVYLRELHKVNADIVQLERDKASAEAMVAVWKESYLDQVRENVRLQAKAYADVAGKYEDKIGDESLNYEFEKIMSSLSEEGKEHWRKFIRKLIKELDNEQT